MPFQIPASPPLPPDARTQEPEPIPQSEPLIGYRTWVLDYSGQLNPAAGYGPAWDRHGATEAICLFHSTWAPLNTTLTAIGFNYPNIAAWRTSLWETSSHPLKKKAPVWECSCGLYAFPEIDRFFTGYDTHTGYIIGAVMCWGKIVTHGADDEKYTEGFRAEYARPCAFLVKEPHHIAIASRYGARQARTRNELVKAASCFGVEVSKTLELG